MSPTAAEALITNPSVVAVVGPAFSGATKAAEPDFSAADLATVSPSATNPALADVGHKNFFRVVADDRAGAYATLTTSPRPWKLKSVFTVDDDSSYGSGLAGALDSRLKHDGVKVTHESAPEHSAWPVREPEQYPALASQVVTSKAPLLYYAGYYCDFALFAKALREAGYKGQLMSDDGSLDPHFVSEATKGVADSTLISCACSALTNAPEDKAFGIAFKQLAGFPSGTYTPEAFDATNVIISVMKSIGADVTRAAIVKGLHKADYIGLTKTIRFEPNGNIAGKTVFVYRVEGQDRRAGSTLSLIKSS